MKHTPGPWMVSADNPAIIHNVNEFAAVAATDGWDEAQQGANAERIVACVNALADVADPAGYLAAVRGLLTHVGHPPTQEARYIVLKGHGRAFAAAVGSVLNAQSAESRKQ